jgi:hypothetical protein
VSDHYSGLFWMWSDDLGKTWTKPAGPAELDWRKESDKVDIGVADVTPGWHARTGRALAIGIKVRYSKAGAELLDKPRSWEFAYAVFDPATKKWTPWRMLAVPKSDTKFYLLGPGCCQWVIKDDGTLLVPAYFRGPKGERFTTTVIHCGFDGKTLKYLAHGDAITINDGRGIYEPSLVRFGTKYYLTLRNDSRGYVTVSADGLRYKPIKPWTFDDGKDLGSYNTQQHWLTHLGGLFLVYTRRGANNDHIIRHRAPLFIARVDPEKLHVTRKTERVLIPERGGELGNFGGAPITADESWVTVSEGVWSADARKRGAEGALFVARVIWSRPNRADNRGWIDLTGEQGLKTWNKPRGEWLIAGGAGLDPKHPNLLTAHPGKEVLVNPRGKAHDLLSKQSFGDIEAHVEFLIPRRSNSGVKFQGLYEIQIYDSFGVKKPTASDCGGIYPRAELKPRYHHIDKGIPPRTNAARPAGEWQTLDVLFRAPRFNAQGKKTASARFVKVILNGQVIHENVELTTPTGHAWRNKELAQGPLLLQADHGPVAFRNVRVRPLPVRVE